MNALERLRALVVAEGEPIAGALIGPCEAREVGVTPDGADRRSPASIAAAGPRAGDAAAEYELLVEAIYEGYLLHYGAPRVVSAADRDLALLAGDRLYTLGLERLVALGDLEAVCELADVIALCSLLVGRGERMSCEQLWRVGARAVGWGADEQYVRTKLLLREDCAAGLEALARLDREGPLTAEDAAQRSTAA